MPPTALQAAAAKGTREIQVISADGRMRRAKASRRQPRRAPKKVEAAPVTPARSKQAQVIAMLKRKGGATVAQIAFAMDWQRHTVRGMISGALRRKLGLKIKTTRTRNTGPNARGGETVYRIA